MSNCKGLGSTMVLAIASLLCGSGYASAEIIRLDVTASVTSVDAGLQPLGFVPGSIVSLSYLINLDAVNVSSEPQDSWISIDAIVSSSFSSSSFSFESNYGGNTNFINNPFDRFRIFENQFVNLSPSWADITIDDTTLVFNSNGSSSFWALTDPIVVTQAGLLASMPVQAYTLDTSVGFLNATVTNVTAVVVPAPPAIAGLVVVGLLAARCRR